MRNLLIIIGLILSPGFASAEVIVSFPFSEDTNPAVQASNVHSASYDGSKLSLSYIGDDGFGYVLQAYPSSGANNYLTAVSNDSYFTTTITPASGQSFNLTQLRFEVGKGGNSDPRGFFVRSSIDGFNADLLSETLPPGDYAAPVEKTITLNGYTNLTTPLQFRFYVYTPNPYGNSVDFRNLNFEYTTPTPIPTLSEWAQILLVLSLMGMAGWYWQRRTS